MKNKIILVGGAGYIGTVLTNHLLLMGYEVLCLDNLIYDQSECIKSFLENENYKFVNIDIRNKNDLSEYFHENCTVILLAGLVGDPISKKYQIESDEINLEGIFNVINICESKKIKRFVFTSTCSNYGITDNNVRANENHELNPLSLYAKAKVQIEKYLLEKKNFSNLKPTILRFATAFGLSPRMRFDLTVNEFTKDLELGKELVVYDAHTWRPYCHTVDFARLICHTIKIDINKISFEVFNVGDNSNNFSKKMIVDEILKYIPNGKVKYLEKGFDKRNYIVDFSKVNLILGFKASYSVQKGIEEIIAEIKKGTYDFRKENQYGNYNLR